MSRAFADKALTLPWLSNLIKAQAIVDSGVRLAARQESILRGQAPACGRGCGGCCSSRRVEATAVEMAGALHYLERHASQAGAASRSPGDAGCPFFLDGACAVHPMRFLSCRQLVVFGRACSPDEDPLRTRRADLLTPLRLHAFKAYSLLLPFLGVDILPDDPLELEAVLKTCLQPVGMSAVRDAVAMLAGGTPASRRAA